MPTAVTSLCHRGSRAFGISPDLLQGLCQPWATFVQLQCMFGGEALQNLSAFARYAQNRPPPVVQVRGSRQQSLALRSIHKFDSAVVSQPQPLRRVGNRHRGSFRSASHLQKKLVLLWMQPRVYRRSFAEVQKAAQLKPEFRQRPKQLVRSRRRK
jgi:hypothetical protein